MEKTVENEVTVAVSVRPGRLVLALCPWYDGAMIDARVLGVHRDGLRLQAEDAGMERWIWDAPFDSADRIAWAWVSGSDPASVIGDGESIHLLDADDERSCGIRVRPGMAVRGWPEGVSRDGVVLAVGPDWCVIRADDDDDSGVFLVSYATADQIHAVVNSAGDAAALPWLSPRTRPANAKPIITGEEWYDDGQPALIFDAPQGVARGA